MKKVIITLFVAGTCSLIACNTNSTVNNEKHTCTESCTKGTHQCGNHCKCGDNCVCKEGATCSGQCKINAI